MSKPKKTIRQPLLIEDVTNLAQDWNYREADDDYLYHVTSAPNAKQIIKEGFRLGTLQTVQGGFYQNYSRGKIFFTEKSGVSTWMQKIQQHLEHAHDDPPPIAVLRIPKAALQDNLQEDELGTRDTWSKSWYTENEIQQRTQKTAQSAFHIFGYIDPTNNHVESTKVPLAIAETYGEKDGVSHLDIFGYTLGGADATWVWDGNKVVWLANPSIEIRHAVDDHLYRRYKITAQHETDADRQNSYLKKPNIFQQHEVEAGTSFPIEEVKDMQKTAQHKKPISQDDYPSLEEIASYVEALKLYWRENKIKDEELKKLVINLPEPANIRKRFSNEEAKVLFHTIGYVWKELTGKSVLEDAKMLSKSETLMGNYWILQKGILISGTNHYTIIKQNLELFRTLLGINAFALHEKMASPPNELIKLVLDHGGVRVFVSTDRRSYFQLTGETYGDWASHKIRKYDFHKKVVKIIDKSAPYSGWSAGVELLLP